MVSNHLASIASAPYDVIQAGSNLQIHPFHHIHGILYLALPILDICNGLHPKHRARLNSPEDSIAHTTFEIFMLQYQ